MGLSKLLVSLIRRVRSVLLLCVTISTLFYYTFQNEIDILNSYAENEFLPSINNEHLEHSTSETTELISNLISVNPSQEQKTPPVIQQTVNKKPKKEKNKNKSKNDLSDPLVLREKNKYFPLLLKSPNYDPTANFPHDPIVSHQDLLAYKENYPILYEISLSSLYYSGDTQASEETTEHSDIPHDIQNHQYNGNDAVYMDHKEEIHSLLLKSWNQQRTHFLFLDFEKAWPLDIIDALDTLYIMEEKVLFQNSLKMIASIDFKIPPQDMNDIDIIDVSTRALGGLLSAYELSQEKILLTKATDLADFLLRAFDTPNRVPLLQYSWKSNYNNRFPYKDANIADFTKMAVEFTRLTQLTSLNKYFDTIYHIYLIISKSIDFLKIESLFPNGIDASTCTLLSNEDIQKGDHQRDSRNMRSIDENLKFVHCHQLSHFQTTSTSYELNSNLLPLYESLLQLFALTQTDILLNAESIPTNSSYIFQTAMSQIEKLFKFEPLVPAGFHNLTLLSNLDTNPIFSPSTNELSIQMRRDFNFHPESCSLGATLAYGSKLFSENIDDNTELAERLTESCFYIAEYLKGSLAVMSLDPCTLPDCTLDDERKVDNIVGGKYIGFSNGFSKDTTVDLNKIDPVDKIKRSVVDIETEATERDTEDEADSTEASKHVDDVEEEEGSITRSFHFIGNEAYMNSEISSIDINIVSKKWIDDPNRPLWINKIEEERLLSPELIKSIFFLYRTTGDEKWRKMGIQLKDYIIKRLTNSNSGAKGVWTISELNVKSGAIPSYWFSQTLKYYYLLFSNPDEYSLDEFILTDGAHFLKRRVLKPST